MTVAVQEKQQIDVFANENGSVTIEQFDWNGGENPRVVVETDDIEAVINALREAGQRAIEQ